MLHLFGACEDGTIDKKWHHVLCKRRGLKKQETLQHLQSAVHCNVVTHGRAIEFSWVWAA